MISLRMVFRVIGVNIGLLARKITGCKVKYSAVCLVSPICSFRTFDGGEIYVGKKCEIRPGSELTARGGIIVLGYNCFINRNCMVISHEKIEIEDKVTIGPGTVIYDHDHAGNGRYVTSPIHIKKGAWIGANSIILKGVTIGENSVIAAGSVVTKNIPDNCVFVQKRHSTILNSGETL